MEAWRLIAQMCVRFGVPLEFGRRMQALVEKAVASEPEKRRLLLELVERSLAEEARRVERERAADSPEERRALSNVAAVLHGWIPPGWFERWDDEPRRIGPS